MPVGVVAKRRRSQSLQIAKAEHGSTGASYGRMPLRPEAGLTKPAASRRLDAEPRQRGFRCCPPGQCSSTTSLGWEPAGSGLAATALPFWLGERTHHSLLRKGFRGISSLRSGIPRSPAHSFLALCFGGCQKAMNVGEGMNDG